MKSLSKIKLGITVLLASMLAGAVSAQSYDWDLVNESYGPGLASMDTNWNVPDNAGWNNPTYHDDEGVTYASITSKSFNALIFNNAEANENGRIWELRIRATGLRETRTDNILYLRLENERLNPATRGTSDARDFQIYFDADGTQIAFRNFANVTQTYTVASTLDFQTYQFMLDDNGYVFFKQVGVTDWLEVAARENRSGSGYGPVFQSGNGAGADWDIEYLKVSSSTAIPEASTIIWMLVPAIGILFAVRSRRAKA